MDTIGARGCSIRDVQIGNPGYNSSSHAVSANVRLRWEYQPGSELFVVFNEQRDTLAPRFPALANRAVIIKINRLFRL